MLFTGEYEHTIDAKQRLAIPADIRGRLDPHVDGEAFYIVPGGNGVPWLWPERVFEAMSLARPTSLLLDEEAMTFEQLLYSQARRLPIDKVGRIRLPERVLSENNLDGAVLILGVKDHLELHDPATWEQVRRANLGKQAEIMLRARRAYEESRQMNHRGGGTDA